jgi:hypothetical protein
MYTVNYQIDNAGTLLDLTVEVEFGNEEFLINNFEVTHISGIKTPVEVAKTLKNVFAADIREELERDWNTENLIELAVEQAEDEELEMRIA